LATAVPAARCGKDAAYFDAGAGGGWPSGWPGP
jgi:hypothetical protein